MDKEKASEKLGIRVTPTLKRRIDKCAEEEGRTPSNLLVNVLTQYLDEIDRAKKLLETRIG